VDIAAYNSYITASINNLNVQIEALTLRKSQFEELQQLLGTNTDPARVLDLTQLLDLGHSKIR
jgi:hypothetical protein